MLPAAKLHLHLFYDLLCSHASFKFSFELYEWTLRGLSCTGLFCQLNSFHIETATAKHANRHFFSPDGWSKHVILFENMEEELVTNGFVWWRLLNTQSAPSLDTSNISMMLFHLQGRSTPCSRCRECLILKPPFWKNKTWYHRNSTTSSPPPSLSLSIRIKVCLFSWPCCFKLSFRYKHSLFFPPPPNSTCWRSPWSAPAR